MHFCKVHRRRRRRGQQQPQSCLSTPLFQTILELLSYRFWIFLKKRKPSNFEGSWRFFCCGVVMMMVIWGFQIESLCKKGRSRNSLKKYYCTLFKNYSKCRIWILAFSTNFCPIKTDLSGNTVWPQASGFQKLVKISHF